MSLRLYLFSLYLTAIIALGLFLVIFMGVNPYNAPTWLVLLFYGVIFIFLLSIFAIIGFYLKVRISNREVVFAHLIPTLRQGALFSFALTGILFFEQVKVLNLWTIVVFLIAIILIELFFRAKK